MTILDKAFNIGCDVIYTLGPKQSFADSVAKGNSLWRLLLLLERPEPNEDNESGENVSTSLDFSQRKMAAWSLMEALSSSVAIATNIVSTSGWLELLGVLIGFAKFTKLWAARFGAAKTLSRLLWDPKLGSLAGKYLFHSMFEINEHTSYTSFVGRFLVASVFAIDAL